MTNILQHLSLDDQVCLALTNKELATKVCFTKEHKIAADRKEKQHLSSVPKHIKKGDVAPWILLEQGHRTDRACIGVLGCNIGKCFWKNLRVKKWAFEVKVQALRRRKFALAERKLKKISRQRRKVLTMEEERKSLVPADAKSKENGFIFAQPIDIEPFKATGMKADVKTSTTAKLEKQVHGDGGRQQRQRPA